MTEKKTTTEAAASEAPRCSWACMTENPCWREATVPRWDFDLNGTGKMLCEEHRLAFDRGQAAEQLDMDLDALHGSSFPGGFAEAARGRRPSSSASPHSLREVPRTPTYYECW